MTRSTDKSIAEINELKYLIQSIWQSHYTGWVVTVRSPFDWHQIKYEGKSLAEACDTAATALKKRGPAQPFTIAQGRRVEPRHKAKRVRLSKRVRLNKRTRL